MHGCALRRCAPLMGPVGGGWQVFITSRKEEVLKAAAAGITAQTGNQVLYAAADVRDADSVKRAIDTLVAQAGLPDIVINNAYAAAPCAYVNMRCVCVHVYVHMCICLRVCVRASVYMYVCLCMHVCMRMCMCVCVCA
jgi:short-subunit dehydrogenase involved in D-alanine esterification of teichoic acids